MPNCFNITTQQLTSLIHNYKHSYPSTTAKLFAHFGRNPDTKSLLALHEGLRKQPRNLTDEEMQTIVDILQERFHHVYKTSESYRNQPNRHSNVLFTNVAHLISDDPNVLALVQAYKNDYSLNNELIYLQDGLCISPENYAFSDEEVKQHMIATHSLTLPLENGEGSHFPLSEAIITRLRQKPEFNALIDSIIDSRSHYQYPESLDATPLYFFPQDKLFITQAERTSENRTPITYCFVIDDIIHMMQVQNRLYNPFTNRDFTNEDRERLMAIPAIRNVKNALRIQQEYYTGKITHPTVLQLKQLVQGLLNESEKMATYDRDVPLAQQAYEKFNDYLQNLSEEERNALYNYQINKWSNYYLSSGAYIQGMPIVKFGDLYTSADASCMHSLAGSLMQMCLQLDPNISFTLPTIYRALPNHLKHQPSMYPDEPSTAPTLRPGM